MIGLSFWSVCYVVSVESCYGIGSDGVRIVVVRSDVLVRYRHLVVVVFLEKGGGVGDVWSVWEILLSW